MHEDLVARKTQRSMKQTNIKTQTLSKRVDMHQFQTLKFRQTQQTHTNPKKKTKEEAKVNMKRMKNH